MQRAIYTPATKKLSSLRISVIEPRFKEKSWRAKESSIQYQEQGQKMG
jgi:hypothetical protein